MKKFFIFVGSGHAAIEGDKGSSQLLYRLLKLDNIWSAKLAGYFVAPNDIDYINILYCWNANPEFFLPTEEENLNGKIFNNLDKLSSTPPNEKEEEDRICEGINYILDYFSGLPKPITLRPVDGAFFIKYKNLKKINTDLALKLKEYILNNLRIHSFKYTHFDQTTKEAFIDFLTDSNKLPCLSIATKGLENLDLSKCDDAENYMVVLTQEGQKEQLIIPAKQNLIFPEEVQFELKKRNAKGEIESLLKDLETEKKTFEVVKPEMEKILSSSLDLYPTWYDDNFSSIKGFLKLKENDPELFSKIKQKYKPYGFVYTLEDVYGIYGNFDKIREFLNENFVALSIVDVTLFPIEGKFDFEAQENFNLKISDKYFLEIKKCEFNEEGSIDLSKCDEASNYEYELYEYDSSSFTEKKDMRKSGNAKTKIELPARKIIGLIFKSKPVSEPIIETEIDQ
jgi:hypothetical protein